MAEPTAIGGRTSPARPFWSFDRRLAGHLVLGWLIALVAAYLAGFGFRVGRPVAMLLMVGESLVYLALYVGLVSLAPVGDWIRSIPSPHRAVFAGFIFFATWGQLVVNSRTTFPFPAWTMYARAEPRRLVDYYRYRGFDAQGREVAIDPAAEFTFVNSAEIASRVKYIGRAATAPADSPKRQAAVAQLRDLLAALAASYNQSHPDARLRSLEFMRYSWDYRTQSVAEVVPSTVVRIDIPEGPAR
jgi:hypothetical protein